MDTVLSAEMLVGYSFAFGFFICLGWRAALWWLVAMKDFLSFIKSLFRK